MRKNTLNTDVLQNLKLYLRVHENFKKALGIPLINIICGMQVFLYSWIHKSKQTLYNAVAAKDNSLMLKPQLHNVSQKVLISAALPNYY